MVWKLVHPCTAVTSSFQDSSLLGVARMSYARAAQQSVAASVDWQVACTNAGAVAVYVVSQLADSLSSQDSHEPLAALRESLAAEGMSVAGDAEAACNPFDWLH